MVGIPALVLLLSVVCYEAAKPSRQLSVVRENTTTSDVMEAINMLKSELAAVNEKLNSGAHNSYPRNCLAAKLQGYNTSGVYTIQPDCNDPFKVWCDMETDGGGWAVFQRRQDGTVNFQRNRIEYIRGFGNISGEYWLGLEKICRLTKFEDFEPELWVDLEDFNNNSRHEHYNRFYITGPPSYTLNAYDPSGTAGDSLAYHNGRGFSTPDHDVDGNSGKNCALTNEGAWWFNNCQYSHLNGKYYYGTSPRSEKGVNWIHWQGNQYSLKWTEMKTRPSRLTWRQKD